MAKKTVDKRPTMNDVLAKEARDVLTTHALTIRREVLERLLNPGKDINYECGYPDTIEIRDYKKMFDREGIARRVVNILPDESWALMPEIYETEKSDETEFEKVWNQLNKERNLLHYLQRVDVLSGIGTFGVLLLGINDGKELSEPVDGIDLKTGKKTGSQKYELLYLRPFDETVVEVKNTEGDTTSSRYGHPTMYTINFEDVETAGTLMSKQVHWTRVLHIADNRVRNEVKGTPRMMPVYNRLLDIRKILSGSAEMFWKGGYPGLSFEIDPELGGDFTAAQKTTLRAEMENYAQGMQRYLAVAGVAVKSLAPQVADPKSHIEAQIKQIAITLGIPYRIFIGTEEAKLSSTQDMKTWNKRISKRQEEYVTPMLIRKFVDRLIIYGILPEVEEYFVDWPDLNMPSDQDKAEVSKAKTEAFAKYVQAGVDSLIPPKEYFMMIMGMTEDEAAAIEKASMLWAADHEEEEEQQVESAKEELVKEEVVI